MTHHANVAIKANVSAQKVWEVLKDFSSVERFSAGVEKSPILGDKTCGLGAKRQCFLYDKTSLIEEIIEYKEGESFKVVLSDYSMPLKEAFASMGAKEVDENNCEISMKIDFVVKFGVLGVVMGKLMIKPMMQKLMKKALIGLAYHASTGKVIGNALPDQAELATIIQE